MFNTKDHTFNYCNIMSPKHSWTMTMIIRLVISYPLLYTKLIFWVWTASNSILCADFLIIVYANDF